MKMKFLSVIAMSMLITTNVFAANVIVNNKKIDVEAMIANGRTLVPVRGIFEELDFDVAWDSEEKAATLSNGEVTIYIKNGENKFNVSGKNVTPDVPQQIIGGRFYLPLRAIVEALPNYDITWNSAEKNVYITSIDTNTKNNAKKTENTTTKTLNTNEPKIEAYTVSNYTVAKNDYVNIVIVTNTDTDRIEVSTDFDEEKAEIKNFEEAGGMRVFEINVKMIEIGSQNINIRAGNKNGYTDDINEVNIEVYEERKETDFNYISDIGNKKNTVNSDLKTESTSIEQLEKEVFALVNKERIDRGIPELEWSDELADVARAHSEDMAENNYFSHTGLDGSSPFERMSDAGISWGSSAENIAAGSSTAEAVMNQWMNSDGHRENILNPDLKRLGVGLAVSSDSTYTYYWTQCFTG